MTKKKNVSKSQNNINRKFQKQPNVGKFESLSKLILTFENKTHVSSGRKLQTCLVWPIESFMEKYESVATIYKLGGLL